MANQHKRFPNVVSTDGESKLIVVDFDGNKDQLVGWLFWGLTAL